MVVASAKMVKSAKRVNGSADALLAATAELLSERAALDVSLSDIAKRSGLNSALIKYYFGNKDGLLLALLERDAKTAMAALKQLVLMPLSADAKLRIHISGIINAYHRSPYLNRLIHFVMEHGKDDASNRVTELFMVPMIAAYHSMIAQGVKEGVFADVDPNFLYFSLVGACDHIFHATGSVRHVLGVQRVTDDIRQRYTDHVTDIALRGMRP